MGGVEKGRAGGSPTLLPLHTPGRTALFASDLLHASYPTPIFALCHTTREGFVFICTAKPPPSRRLQIPLQEPAWCWICGADRLEVAGYTGGAAGSEGRGREAVALGRTWAPLGPHMPCRAVPPHCGTLGSGRVGDCDVRWPILSQHQEVSPGWPEGAHPPRAPRSIARLRWPGDPRPRDHILYMIFEADTIAHRCC